MDRDGGDRRVDQGWPVTGEYLLGMYEKATPATLTWEERFEVVRISGFDYMEMSIDESDERLARLDWAGRDRRELVRAMDGQGVPIGSICLSAHRRYPLGSHDPKIRARALDIMQKTLELACDIGARAIQLAGYDVYYERSDLGTRARFAENLSRVAQMAARSGVQLGFETMETPFMDTVGKAMAYVGQIGNPYLGVYPDVGNLTNAALLYGTAVSDDIATGAGHIIAAHCKETAPGSYREIAFGTGTTDYEGALSELVAQGVRRFVAEFWYTGANRWRQEASDAAAYVRGKVDAALAPRPGGSLTRPRAATCAPPS